MYRTIVYGPVRYTVHVDRVPEILAMLARAGIRARVLPVGTLLRLAA